jgi:hypothetical protein
VAFDFSDFDLSRREQEADFRVSVKHCSLCPFSSEHTDECGDFTGISCTVTNETVKFPACCEIVPACCPLRKGVSVIIVSLADKEK